MTDQAAWPTVAVIAIMCVTALVAIWMVLRTERDDR